VLPPLYHEAMDGDLKGALVAQIRRCFPFFEGTQPRANFRGTIEVVELPRRRPSTAATPPRVLGFSVDTTIEQHGPHLPLGTDTIQSYAVLDRLAKEIDGFVVGPPIEYGHLTWGLPFGLSIDITPALCTRYMTAFVNALVDWMAPKLIYVVDVHGSLVHRNAMHEGLRRSRCARGAFRWIHEPLAEFSSAHGDMHAGGVETALIEYINPALVDSNWWPGRTAELVAGQMALGETIELSGDMPRFIQQVESRHHNGIVGDVRHASSLDASMMMSRMVELGRNDVAAALV
jgi:creatinine amidohydrolase